MNRFDVIFSVLLLFAGPSVACSYPDPPSFSQALRSAETVAVVHVESASLKEDRLADGGHIEWIETSVRVVETVHGPSAKIRTLTHEPSSCGGIRLDPGAYVVVALRVNDEPD